MLATQCITISTQPQSMLACFMPTWSLPLLHHSITQLNWCNGCSSCRPGLHNAQPSPALGLNVFSLTRLRHGCCSPLAHHLCCGSDPASRCLCFAGLFSVKPTPATALAITRHLHSCRPRHSPAAAVDAALQIWLLTICRLVLLLPLQGWACHQLSMLYCEPPTAVSGPW